MRHTHASHSITNGTPIQVAQRNLGHASLGTTTIYVTTEKKERLKKTGAFWAQEGRAVKATGLKRRRSREQ